MDLIRPELYELFALEFAKIAESDFVYSLASSNLDQLVPNMVTIYTEPKKKLSRDLNGTISTFAFINSFYSYLLLHNDGKSIHQSSCTV